MTRAYLKIPCLAAFALFSTPVLPQVSKPQIHTSDIGFTYSLPGDWVVVGQQPVSPVVKQEEEKAAPTPEEKKGMACVEVVLTARHGEPASAIVAVTLPFDCYGQTFAPADLQGFGEGAVEGLKQAFDITASSESTYMLGRHSMWMERAVGAAKGQLERVSSTVEVTCTVLKKGAACWMVVAADDAALKTFESGVVTLDGGAARPLVPPDAAAKVAALGTSGR